MESTVQHVLQTVEDVQESHSHKPIEEDISDTITIHTPPSDTILLDLEFPLMPFKSNNEERVLDALKPKSTLAASRLQREICIEDVCFHPSREKVEENDHSGHKTIKYSVLLKELQVLKCNHRLTEADSQQTMHLLDSIDRIYEEILCFQDEMTRLFQQVKLQAQRHINTVKQSFLLDHYHRMRKQLQQCFDYANVKYALAEIEKFKLIEYPSLDYPRFKVGSMQKRIGLANVNNKLIGVEAINSWVQRLQALDKKDRKVIYNRSIATFLNKSTCEKPIFSHYLRASEYSSTNSKVLRRLQAINQNIPVAVVEKEMLAGTELKFRVTNLGKGMFIGISTMRAIHHNNFQNLVMEEGSYYLSSRGDILPFDQERRRQITRMPYHTGDEISIRRQKNTINWKRKGQGKSEQQVRITLSLTEFAHNFYVCVHLQDAEGVLQLID